DGLWPAGRHQGEIRPDQPVSNEPEHIACMKEGLMADESTPRRIGVIGLGKMGSALADVLLAGGFEVAVWNRTGSKTERLAKAGATPAASVLDAARTS